MGDRTQDAAKAFWGVGWSFPVHSNPETRDIAMAIYEQDIRQAIQIILVTALGERVMRPDFGVGLQALVFEPMNTTTRALTEHRVELALISWEPRIDRIKVGVDTEPQKGRVMVGIRYRIRSTNAFYNLVYPF